VGYERILVTLDGSKLAETALQHVKQVARPGAQIHLLSIMAEDRIGEIAAFATAVAQVGTAGRESRHMLPDPRAIHAREDYLRQIGTWFEQAGFEITVEVRPGHVVDMIIDVARDGFDVVILATHGRTGFSRVALGSVAEGVLHRSPCPVLIIPAA
jgi:nucleotide-binding universal stress UspA family protein